MIEIIESSCAEILKSIKLEKHEAFFSRGRDTKEKLKGADSLFFCRSIEKKRNKHERTETFETKVFKHTLQIAKEALKMFQIK